MATTKKTEKRICQSCNKFFMAFLGEVNRGGAKSCSRNCFYEYQKNNLNSGVFKKGVIPWNKGKELPEEYRKKISDTLKGRKLSVEIKRKIGEANNGKKRTEEQKIKYSECKKGIKFSEKHKESLRKSSP